MSFRPCVAWWKLLGILTRPTFFLVFVVGPSRTPSLICSGLRERSRPFLVFRVTRGGDTTRASSSGFLKSTADSGELRATLVRRAIHYGFRMPELLVSNFVTNLNAISSVLPPCVLASVLRTVCNAWTTSRRFRDEHPHCRLGCQAVGGDDIRHYPFCPVFLQFVAGTSVLSDCLWAHLGELSFFMLVQTTAFEDMVRTAVWVDVFLQGVNWMRLHPTETFLERVFHSRLRATLARAPAAGFSVFPG